MASLVIAILVIAILVIASEAKQSIPSRQSRQVECRSPQQSCDVRYTFNLT
jgi:hypothetical protein